MSRCCVVATDATGGCGAIGIGIISRCGVVATEAVCV